MIRTAKNYTLIFILLLLPAFSTAQLQVNSKRLPGRHFGKNIRFERIMVENGLPGSFVHDILQDHLGFIWFATDNGLCKYDGYTFTIYRHDPEDSTSIGSGWVTDIFEDRSGFLWLATQGGGLNKYDREKEIFIRYKYEKGNPASISSGQVECIAGYMREGKEILWIGTARGLNKFNPRTEKFIRYPHTELRFPYTYVETVLADKHGKIWIGCTEGGLYQFDPEIEKFTHFRHNPDNDKSLSSNNIFVLFEDRSGVLWVGTTGSGLNKFDRDREEFIVYRHDAQNPASISNDIIDAVFEDKSGVFWVGTGEGLNILDRQKESFIHYVNNPGDPNSLSDNSIMCIEEDKSGVLWMGTWGGVNKVDPQKNQFSQIRHIPGNKNSLSDNSICCVHESSYGGEDILWIGTKNGGLNRLNRKTGEVDSYQHHAQDPNSLINNFVYAICEGRSGVLWIGNFLGGLNKLDRSTGKITRYKYDPDNPNSLSCPSVRSIVQDKNGLLWIGTQTGGINTFDPASEQFSLVSDKMHIKQVYLNRSGELWFGTMRGLKKYDRKTNQFITYRHNPANPASIGHNFIQTIYESEAGDLWLGTSGAGLDRFDRESEKFIHYTVKDGLPSDLIISILEDEQNNLWIGTTKGLSKFNPRTEVFKNYDFQDGLISNEFIEGASCRCRDGQMLFGFINGLNAFYPANIKDNRRIPPVYITSFLIFNKPVKVRSDDENKSEYTLPGNISALDMIELPYTESVFSFEFAALDYHSPQKNQYAYQMKGVDPDWVFTDALRRFATYTQLQPGEYVFRVKGSNNDGYWNEQGAELKVIILPPWWRTKLAYIFYILLFGTVVIATWRIQLRRIRLKNQLKMEHFEAEKLREVDQLKSRFFANISHEFRTPLTLIKGPVTQIMDSEIADNLKQKCKIVLRYSDRLAALINQILDLSKLEAGEVKLQVIETDIIQYLRGLVLTFSPLADRKKISLKFKLTENNLTGFVDRDKLEKIVTNLLSNAFKFTPDGGEIVLIVKIPKSKNQTPNKSQISNYQFLIPNSDFVEISISNTGPGIPIDQLGKIFDRFYQTDSIYKKGGEGSGIGLALTKELVEVCQGEITVFSIPGKTTTFVVTLPIARSQFHEDEIVTESLTHEADSSEDPGSGLQDPEPSDQEPGTRIQESRPKHLPPVDWPGSNHPGFDQQPVPRDQKRVTSSEERSANSESRKASILIVEDNPDVTNYICSFMDNKYLILTAENGKEGYKKALETYPDLIISDVMMPEMDGFELCQKIKADERISHIPVILLTANADVDSKIEGLKFGADDYISKPFEADELKVRANNLIEQRIKLREKFSRLIETRPAEIAATSMDEQFLRRLLNVFEDHIAQSDFSTEDFAREVGMSRSNLHLKLKALTNQPTHDFLRTLRLKRAAQLLQKSAGTVTEIAYAVGFNNPSYFSRVFRQQFGKTPSEFAKSD